MNLLSDILFDVYNAIKKYNHLIKYDSHFH